MSLTGQESIAGNVAAVRARIAAACARAGRDPGAVSLIAVSKKMPVTAIQAAFDAGIRDFGENRLEEAGGKIPQLPGEIRWHMVGHVQSRKASEVVDLPLALVHSLDDLKLARRYSNFATEKGRILTVLLQMNVSGEETKSGWAAYNWKESATQRAALWAEVETILSLPGLRVAGLMTMAPIVEDMAQTRPVFQALAALREALQSDFPSCGWEHLSMGMTDDFEVALEEGATLVRIGRAIFGERPV